jgi:uncharacterized DUF497 family protein
VHTINRGITFDPRKNERNIRERGLPFERAADFDFGTATFYIDARRDYGEIRTVAIGYLDRRLHALCFTETATGIRVISFRRANRREARQHGRPQTLDRRRW